MSAGEQIILSLASGGSGDGIIGFEGHGAAGDRQTTTRLLDGEFPKVRHIMNTQPVMTVRLNTADTIAAARRVSLVAERNTSLRMLIGDGVVTLEAATGDQAQASEALEAVVDQPGGGDPAVTAAGFNPTYLLDALGAFDTPYVNFAFTAPSKPCQLTGLAEIDGDPITDYRHVIMLMRLPDLTSLGAASLAARCADWIDLPSSLATKSVSARSSVQAIRALRCAAARDGLLAALVEEPVVVRDNWSASVLTTSTRRACRCSWE